MPAIFSNVRFQEKILFTKHLSTMYRAGIPLTDALSTLIVQTRSNAFKRILQGVLSDVDNGQSLAKSLSKHPKVFDEFYVSLIRVSEESGTLEKNLDFLSKQLTKDYSLRKKIKSALFYPAIVVGIMVLMGVFISFFVLPKLVGFFESFDVELPFTTKILLYVANVVGNYGLLIFLALVGLIILLRFSLKWAPMRFFWHRLIIRAPLFGNLISYGQVARFSRNLGTLIQSGVPISRSLEVTANTLTNIKFRKDLLEIGKQLTKGKEIGLVMKSPKYWEYPPIVSQMISVGEQSGKLDEVLLYLSEFYEEEIDDLSKNLATVLEPVLLVIIALMVGFVALAIISPIYELTGSIGR